MEMLAQIPGSYSEKDQISLHLALAKAYADIGWHERSFRQLLEGNALKRRSFVYDEAAELRRFERIPAVFTPAFINRHRDLGAPSPVPVFIVGMPRSGTTLVEQILASHPAVFGAGELEDFRSLTTQFIGPTDMPTPFPESAASLTGAQLRQLGAAYLDRIQARAPTAARITDKLPINFAYAGLIHLALPQARIIHLRRNPLDTCLSCFSKLFVGEHSYSYELGELGRFYRAYESVMAHWRSVLPPSVMLEVHYEELIDDLEGQARRLVGHCGLEWDPTCLAFHTTQRPVRTASAGQVRQPIYRSSVARWKPYEHLLSPLIEALDGKPRRDG
ncbi:MAG: sulfotransferase [Pseudomonadota bacterium]